MAIPNRDSTAESGRRRARPGHVVPPPPVRNLPPPDQGAAQGESFGFFDCLPAWVISLVLHMVAILLAGMWFIGPEHEEPWITLSTSIQEEELEGELVELDDPVMELPPFEDADKVSLDTLADLEPPGQPEVTVERPVVTNLPAPGDLPDPEEPSDGSPSVGLGGLLAGRDPRLRQEILRREGGTSATEAAVALGLKWLARHQNAKGSWSLHAFHKAPAATNPPEGLGQPSDIAATALALLPFLGAGNTHQQGEYRYEVSRGLTWLVAQQGQDGDLRDAGIGRMYSQGLAAIVLCEAYAMTGDKRLREPAQKAIDFIVKAQHSAGGWRYSPGDAGDTSVFGWQLMALRSGKMAYLRVPDSTFRLASQYLNRAKTDRYGSLYSYQPGQSPTPSMTAEALLCRQYLGWPKRHPGLQAGVRQLLNRHPPRAGSPDIYYWYYATQVMHHMGGRIWDQWNRQMREIIVDLQRTDGAYAGSWDPRGPHAGAGGRLYMTSLALCILEVYYRHLPMYQSDIVQEYHEEDET